MMAPNDRYDEIAFHTERSDAKLIAERNFIISELDKDHQDTLDRYDRVTLALINAEIARRAHIQ